MNFLQRLFLQKQEEKQESLLLGAIKMIMVKAHAKINVALNIDENKLANGYHNIDSIMLPLELHDRIEFEFLPAYFDTMITCDDVSIPTDESNLIVKAFNAEKRGQCREIIGY